MKIDNSIVYNYDIFIDSAWSTFNLLIVMTSVFP